MATASAPAPGTYSVHVHGDITSIISASEFQLQGGSGVGYVHVFVTSSTAKYYNGLSPKAGEYADVYATGTLRSGNLTATQLTLTSSSSAAVTGTYSVHVSGSITAMISSSEFQLQGGRGVGYVHVFVNSSTAKYYNGLALRAGDYADVYATGTLSSGNLTAVKLTLSSSSSGGTTPSTPPPSTTVTGGVPKHVLTAGLIYGYSGTPTSVPVTSISPYLNWAETDPTYAPTLRSHGIKVALYMNFWRNYSSDNPAVGYTDLKPGGAHASAEARTCSGTPLYDKSYGGGYQGNAMSPTYASEHAKVVANYRETEFGSNYDALFADDTGSVWGLSGTPCNYSDSAWQSGVNTVEASLAKPMFINALNGVSKVFQAGYANPSNVIGAMCESCYSYWDTVNGVRSDFARYGSTWTDTENAEALMASRHKIFWEYARAIGSAASEVGLRNYTYASFLMTYDPNYSMLQEVWHTPSGFEVFPESGLVPMNPVTTYSNVSGYQRSGGAYMREFGACYYRGVNKGRCAVVVNNTKGSEPMPTTAYGHAMVLSGYGVLDGGSVSFAGSRPSSLGPTTGYVLFP